MKIIFAGTPDISVPVLEALQQSEHDIVMVMTQPDRPAGRGRKVTASPVKQCAEQFNLPIYQPTTLKDPTVQATLSQLNADVMVVIAYGLIVPKQVLDIPKLGCINLHVSLLPRWRGAAPIQRTILAGDTLTGVTMMQMDRGLDTGDILAHKTLALTGDETSQSLHDTLSVMSAELLMAQLPALANGELPGQHQDEEAMTYAGKIEKAEACIDWQLGAQQIERMVRAFNPWPIAYTIVGETRLRIWQADVINELTDAPCGMILTANKHGIDIACGGGVLRIKELQWPGGKRQPAHAALNASNHPFIVGTILGANE